MSVLDVDKMINDPWEGLRDTETYLNYVMMEVQRLYESGELEVSSDEVWSKYQKRISCYDQLTSFEFDGRKFNYLYYKKELYLSCDDWDWDDTLILLNKYSDDWDVQLIVWKGKLIHPSNLSFYQKMFLGCQ